MKKFALLLPCLAAWLIPGADAQGPGSSNASTYKIEITIRDASDPDAAKSPRRYTILTGGQARSAFHVVQRLPYPLNPPSADAQAQRAQVAVQYQFIEIGVDLDCSVREIASSGKLTLTTSLRLTNGFRGQADSNIAPPAPMPATTSIQAETPVTPGERTLIATVDDPVNSRKIEIEVLVTNLK